MSGFTTKIFPKTRIATNDVCAVGLQKHHITAIIEVDVTDSRKRLKHLKRENKNLSFSAWLVKEIGVTVKAFSPVAGFLSGKRQMIMFDDVNISFAVEKQMGDEKVPIPLVIEKANEKTIEQIYLEISQAQAQTLSEKDIVLRRKSSRMERFYFMLPGFLRRYFWRSMLKHPHFAYAKMGNVAFSSIGAVGHLNGWFIPISVHPICVGVSGLSKKPGVVNDKIEVREVLNITVLMDHDVVDGTLMAKFIQSLTKNLEAGSSL